jgi:hypothetical protein
MLLVFASILDSFFFFFPLKVFARLSGRFLILLGFLDCFGQFARLLLIWFLVGLVSNSPDKLCKR